MEVIRNEDNNYSLVKLNLHELNAIHASLRAYTNICWYGFDSDTLDKLAKQIKAVVYDEVDKG